MTEDKFNMCGSWKWTQELVCRPNNYCLPRGRVHKCLPLVQTEVPPGRRVALPATKAGRVQSNRVQAYKFNTARWDCTSDCPHFQVAPRAAISVQWRPHETSFCFFYIIQTRGITLPLCIL